MSTTDLQIFGPDKPVDLLNPELGMVLRGYDPEQVRGYLAEAAARIQNLERQLEDARSDADALRRRYAMAREEAYGQVAARMAEVLRTADREALKMRKSAEDEATRLLNEVRQQVEQMRSEAETEAERRRRETDERVKRAHQEEDRIIDGLIVRRDAMLDELQVTRDRLSDVLAGLDETIGKPEEPSVEVSDSAQALLQPPEEAPSEPAPDDQLASAQPGRDDRAGDAQAPNEPAQSGQAQASQVVTIQADDLLETAEGFDLVLPDFLGEGDQGEEQAETTPPD